MHELFSDFFTWYMANINYYTIALLMCIESTFVPLPSEVVVPPAAWKAMQGELSMVGVVLAGTVGALIGATINYVLAMTLGRKVLYYCVNHRFAKIFLLNEAKLQKAENFFKDNGILATFIGRLVPGVRHLISIPAGLSKMNFFHFALFTFIGAGVWNICLAILGVVVYQQRGNLEVYYKEISIAGLVLGTLFTLFLIYRARRGTK